MVGMSIDNRQAPRVSLDVQVNFSTSAIAHAKNISEGGICLITELPLTVGKIFTLSFTFPGEDKPVQTYGKVVWSRPATEHFHENGVSFFDIEPAVQKRVLHYLSSQPG